MGKYSLTQDLFVLAAKSYNSGDFKSASKLFAQACSCSDLPLFVNTALSSDIPPQDTQYAVSKISGRVLATIEEYFTVQGPLELSELKMIVAQIKHLACDCSEDDEGLEDDGDVSLDSEEDVDEEVEAQGCPECNTNPCSCEYDSEGTTKETEQSSSVGRLEEEVKNSLVSLKVRSNDWEVKKFIPILIEFFPDLAAEDKGARTHIGPMVNSVLNRLRSLDIAKLAKLNAILKQAQET